MRLLGFSGRSLFRGMLFVGFVTLSSAARAHPLVDEAATRIEHAEFDSALELLARASATGALTRTDVLRLLELRALVDLALGHSVEAERSLTVLATLDPAHRFAPNTSPDLLVAFEAAKRAAAPTPRVTVERTVGRTALDLRVRIDGDRLGLVRSTGLQVRVNRRPWRFSEGPTAHVAVSPGDRVQYAAQCRGESGVVLESAVREYVVPSKTEPPASGPSPWWYVAGGAVAAVLVVVGIVILGSGDDRTQPSPPSFEAR